MLFIVKLSSKKYKSIQLPTMPTNVLYNIILYVHTDQMSIQGIVLPISM